MINVQEYKEITEMKGAPPEAWVYLGCTMFFLGMYKEAEEACGKGMSGRSRRNTLISNSETNPFETKYPNLSSMSHH